MSGLNKQHTVEISELQKCLQAKGFFFFLFFLEVLTHRSPLPPVFMLSAFN